MIKKISITVAIMLATLSLNSATQAASQCSGLSSSACSAKSSCTWRKASVNKNGNKTKAHCRALPGQSKASKTNKTKASKKTTKKSKTSAKPKKKSKSGK